MTDYECCLIKKFVYLFEKFYIYRPTLTLEMASPGNRHCANCIGTLSIPLEAVTIHPKIRIATNKAYMMHAFICIFLSHMLSFFNV